MSPRLIAVGFFLLPLLFYYVTLPEIAIARNNSGAPRTLDWRTIQNGKADLTHGYVSASGYVSPTVLTETKTEDGLAGKRTEVDNTYEVLGDPVTGTEIVINHGGGNHQVRTGKAVKTTVTGLLVPAESKVMEHMDGSEFPHLNRSYQLTVGRTPGNIVLLYALAGLEIIGFVALIGFSIRAIARWRAKPKNGVAVAGTTSDWKKFRIDG